MRYNWSKIETEYVTGNISMERLAERYGIANSTFFKKAKERNFVEKRREFREKAEGSARARAREKLTRKLEKGKNSMLEGFCAGAERYKEFMTKKDLFNSHIVSGDNGPTVVVLEVPDAKRVLNMSAMGRNLVDTYRQLTGENIEAEDEKGGVIIFAPREDIQ